MDLARDPDMAGAPQPGVCRDRGNEGRRRYSILKGSVVCKVCGGIEYGSFGGRRLFTAPSMRFLLSRPLRDPSAQDAPRENDEENNVQPEEGQGDPPLDVGDGAIDLSPPLLPQAATHAHRATPEAIARVRG